MSPLLNTATKVYAGTAPAVAVYQGAVKVWPQSDGYGPPQSVYTTQTGTPTTSAQQTLGARIVIAAAGKITTLRWLRPSTTSAAITTRTLKLWNDNATPVQLASASTVAESGPGWKDAVLATPYTVTAGQAIRVSISNPDNMSLNFGVGGFPIVNGDLTLTHSYRDAAAGPPITSRTTDQFIDLIFRKTL